ncbi:hypothetical protein [Streptomyces sp. WMMC940]|uniref:hypothetical protein n=1 Tax=Streptomyces sp. WMMC940 TaxID=3015153 RepID=UPI0022B7045B|nr:hypothetical protein [Streptomyces sp. WMMC940]MCZ7462346.1 hypothetical protein [Streptomyces sp. WMMC940]
MSQFRVSSPILLVRSSSAAEPRDASAGGDDLLVLLLQDGVADVGVRCRHLRVAVPEVCVIVWIWVPPSASWVPTVWRNWWGLELLTK